MPISTKLIALDLRFLSARGNEKKRDKKITGTITEHQIDKKKGLKLSLFIHRTCIYKIQMRRSVWE